MVKIEPIWDGEKEGYYEISLSWTELGGVCARETDIYHPDVSQWEEVIREVDGDQLTGGVEYGESEQ